MARTPFQFDADAAGRQVAVQMEAWLKMSGLTVEEMVALVGKYQPKATRERGAWSRWKRNPKSVSVLTYFAMRDVAEWGNETQRQRALGTFRDGN